MTIWKALLNRAIPKLTGDERVNEVKTLLRRAPPARIVIDAGLPAGAWYVVRGLATPQEQAIADAAAASVPSAWAQTRLMERD